MSTETITTLRANIESTADSREKILLIDRLVEILLRKDIRLGLRYARKGVRLARASGDTALLARGLTMLGWLYFEKEDYDSMPALIAEIGELLETISGDYPARVQLSHLSGSFHLVRGDYAESIAALTSSFDILDRVDDVHAMKILGTTADTYLQLGYFSKSLELLARVEKMAEKNNHQHVIAHCTECTGRIYMMMKNPQAALEKFRWAYDMMEKQGQQEGMASALGNIGLILLELDGPEAALPVIEQARELQREFGTRQNLAYSTLTMAEIISEKNAAAAMNYATEALEILESLGDLRGQVVARSAIGEIYLKGGELPRAIDSFLDALGIAEQIGQRVLQCGLHELLATAHERLGEPARSLEHYKHFVELERDLRGQEAMTAIAMAEARAEIDRAEQDREIYRMKNSQLEREMELKQKELAGIALQLLRHGELMKYLEEEARSSMRDRGESRGLARNILSRIEQNRHQNDAWTTFEERFNQVHSGFIPKLLQRCTSLTPAELKICALLKINLSSKEIGSLLNISSRTVDIHRTSIRRKLDLDTATNLTAFLATL